MRKAFAIIFIIISVLAICLGIAGLVDLNSKSNTFEGVLAAAFSENYRNSYETQQEGSLIFLIGGLILLIIGILLIPSGKSRREKKSSIEAAKIMAAARSQRISEELEIQKHNAELRTDKIEQLERLGKLFKEGIITEEEFKNQKSIILR